MSARKDVTVSINVQKRLINMWNEGGNLITHVSLDVDALLSAWLVYYYLNGVFSVTIEEFVKRIKLEPANVDIKYPDYGVDIGNGIGENHVKEGNFPVAINGNVYTNPCASMMLASSLLCERDFRAIKDMIADVHTVDTTGTAINKEQNKALVSIWGILGALQNNMDFYSMFSVVDQIFHSMLVHSSQVREDALMKLLEVKTINVGEYTIVITPLNSGRHLSEKCFHELYANVVIWASFDESSNSGTVGISVSRKFSQKFDLRSLERYAGVQSIIAEIGDLFFAQHICGRTTKSPISNTSEEKILHYRSLIQKEIINMIQNSEENPRNKG
jgi:hypothetical protein